MHEIHKDTVAISIEEGVLPEIVDLFGLSEEKSSEDEQDHESLIEEVDESESIQVDEIEEEVPR